MQRSLMTYLPSLLAVIASGCASIGQEGGGADNLPNRGIIPYTMISAEDLGADTGLLLNWTDAAAGQFTAPHAMSHDDSALLFSEWYESEGEDGVIVRAESSDGLHFGPPEVVLDADARLPWLGGRVGAPSVIRHDGMWFMVFEFGQGWGIGLAWSVDGRHFIPHDQPLLEPVGADEAGGIYSPSAVMINPNEIVLFYESRSADGVASLHSARSDETWQFVRDGLILGPGVGCLDIQGQPETCWDAQGVAQPDVRLATTASGRRLLRLVYVGIGQGGKRLGFAASFDGAAWSRFALNPTLTEPAPLSHPSNLRIGARYMMYMSAKDPSGSRGVRVGVSTSGQASETWD